MKSFLILSLLISTTSIFASENIDIELTGSKYGIPTGHVQVKNPKIKLGNYYQEFDILADSVSAEVACGLIGMNLVSYKTKELDNEATVISFNSDKDMNLEGSSKYIISAVHCILGEKK